MNGFIIQSDLAEIARGLGATARAFSGKTVLITGGRGFLGRYFTETFAYLNERVLAEPCRVLAMDNLITAGAAGAKTRSFPGYKFIKHDVVEPFAPRERVDFILHAAGIASPHYYRAYPLETLEVAVQGTKRMLELARLSSARMLFFSSSEIYGNPDPKSVPTPESYRGSVSCLGPRACYDESKRLGETLCEIFHTKHGVTVSIVRPFNVYGPGMQENDYRVLPNFASRIKGGLPVSVYGGGAQTRTFCYITDAINGFLRALVRGRSSEAYNVGNPTPEVSMQDLVRRIESVLGRRVGLKKVSYPASYPADEPLRRCPDISKATKTLGYRPGVSLDEGLRRFLAWSDSAYTGRQKT